MAFFKYSLIRGLLFVLFFLAAYFLLHLGSLSAAILAILCAFLVSFIFLRGQRDKATAVIAERFAPNADTTQSAAALSDAEAEDALIDANPEIQVDADRHAKGGQAQTEAYQAQPER